MAGDARAPLLTTARELKTNGEAVRRGVLAGIEWR
jgi:hypothetical protein